MLLCLTISFSFIYFQTFPRSMNQEGIPLYIEINIMPTRVSEDITQDDTESDDEVFHESKQVSVASLVSGQTRTSGKSVLPSPTTRSKRKHITTPVNCKDDIVSPTRSSRSKAISPNSKLDKDDNELEDDEDKKVASKKRITPIPIFNEDEIESEEDELDDSKKVVQLKKRMNADQNNALKTAEAIEGERAYLQSLFEIYYHTGPTIKWVGWTNGYIQKVKLSKKGEQYAKSKSKSNN